MKLSYDFTHINHYNLLSRNYTKNPHLGGTDGERRLGEILYRTWQDQGLDHVSKVNYRHYHNVASLFVL